MTDVPLEVWVLRLWLYSVWDCCSFTRYEIAVQCAVAHIGNSFDRYACVQWECDFWNHMIYLLTSWPQLNSQTSSTMGLTRSAESLIHDPETAFPIGSQVPEVSVPLTSDRSIHMLTCTIPCNTFKRKPISLSMEDRNGGWVRAKTRTAIIQTSLIGMLRFMGIS